MPLCLAPTAAGLRITSRDRSGPRPSSPPVDPPVLATELGELLVTEGGERLAVEP
jgi:hypothetical protein